MCTSNTDVRTPLQSIGNMVPDKALLQMLTLWALLITLAIQAGAPNKLPLSALLPLLTKQVPLSTPLNAINTLPVPLPLGNLPTNPSIPKSSSSTKRLTGTPRGRCQTSARYFMSTSKLDECK